MKQLIELSNWIKKLMAVALTSGLIYTLIEITDELVAVSWN